MKRRMRRLVIALAEHRVATGRCRADGPLVRGRRPDAGPGRCRSRRTRLVRQEWQHPEPNLWVVAAAGPDRHQPATGTGRASIQDLGQCTRCIPACPTDAIVAPYVVDNRRCISYLTIEHKGAIPRDLRPAMGTWVFGCDICQEVCPVNRKAKATSDPNFGRRDLTALDLVELLDMDEEQFRQRFAGTPLMRAKWAGMQRNACVALGNLGDAAAVPALTRALVSGDRLVRQHAAWALGRIGGAEALAALRAAEGVEPDEDVRAEIRPALDEADAVAGFRPRIGVRGDVLSPE